MPDSYLLTSFVRGIYEADIGNGRVDPILEAAVDTISQLLQAEEIRVVVISGKK